MKRPIKRFCLRGHDRYAKGEPLYGMCRECDRLRKQRLDAERAKTNPRAHRRDKPIQGLRKIREEFGLSQRQMARVVGISPSRICELEHGAKASVLTQQKLLEAIVKIRTQRRDKQRRLEKAGLL